MTQAPGIIAVFAKPPRDGEVKTRLASDLGETVATALARAFFADTWESLTHVAGTRRVLASTSTELGPFGLSSAEVWEQGDGDLGARLERVAARALSVAPWFVALGADSPGLPFKALSAAKVALQSHDAVLGPSADGGFYLLGLRRAEPGLLSMLPWSASNTSDATRTRLAERRYATAILQPWFDVDTLADLIRLECALKAGEARAPRTAELLATLGLP